MGLLRRVADSVRLTAVVRPTRVAGLGMCCSVKVALPGPRQVPGEVAGEHADEHVAADPAGAVVVDRTLVVAGATGWLGYAVCATSEP